jgi:hypothetical protein
MRYRNDRHDTDPYELTLIRATHHIWRLLRQERRDGAPDLEALDAAIDTMVRVKRVYRAELAAKRQRLAVECRARLAKREQQAAVTTSLPSCA